MPKGPNDRKRPADAIGCAVMVGRIATEEIIDALTGPQGSVGGIAKAAKLSPAKRSEVARLAAKRRWQREGRDDMNTPKAETVARGREAVSMYPNNSLQEPVREYRNAVAEVVKNTFTK